MVLSQKGIVVYSFIVAAAVVVSTNMLVNNQTIVVDWKCQGAVSIRKTVLPGMAIPMLKIRRPNGRLIFNMEIAIRR